MSHRKGSPMFSISTIVREVADMLSDGDNVEYDRACVEIVMHFLPTDMEDDTRKGVEAMLRAIKEA